MIVGEYVLENKTLTLSIYLEFQISMRLSRKLILMGVWERKDWALLKIEGPHVGQDTVANTANSLLDLHQVIGR